MIYLVFIWRGKAGEWREGSDEVTWHRVVSEVESVGVTLTFNYVFIRCQVSVVGFIGFCSLIYRDLFETLTTVCNGLTHCVSVPLSHGLVLVEQQGSRSVPLGHKLSRYMGSIYVVEWYILLSYVSSTLLRVLHPGPVLNNDVTLAGELFVFCSLILNKY